jgi:hypothetical protein
MSAAQELFQTFYRFISTRCLELPAAAVSIAASVDGKTRVADEFGMRKRLVKYFHFLCMLGENKG